MLGVSRTSAGDEILRAFRARAHKSHPDKHPAEGSAATERMKALLRARDTLLDPTRRAAYDRDLEDRARREGRAREAAERETRERASRAAAAEAERQRKAEEQRERAGQAERERLERERRERDVQEQHERATRERVEREAAEAADRVRKQQHDAAAAERGEQARQARESSENEQRQRQRAKDDAEVAAREAVLAESPLDQSTRARLRLGALLAGVAASRFGSPWRAAPTRSVTSSAPRPPAPRSP